METVELHLCGKCGQSFSESNTFISHCCSTSLTASSRITQVNDKEMAPTAVCPAEDSHPQTSERPKRKRIPNPAYAPPLHVEPRKRGHTAKRDKKEGEMDKRAGVPDTTDAPPSKDYLAEGSEHIYRTHTCPACRRCFKTRSHLREHLLLHFPDPRLQCPSCQRHFTSKSKLRVHRLREVGDKLHCCPLCDYAAVERAAIRRHLAGVHGDRAGGSYPCPTCGQNFGQSRSLKFHMKTHNVLPGQETPAACFQDGCPFRGCTRKELLGHMATEHGVEAMGCRHHACTAVFPTEEDMERHYRTHLAYHCPQCEFSCSNKTLLLRHQRRGHAGTQELRCRFCAFATFNPVEFEQHLGHLHASEKTHCCPQCTYVTSHKRALTRHMLMHSGEKPHKCSLCDFRCRDESYLSKHMLTHSDDKSFMCSECGYVTKWKHYLNVHMRKHTGDLRYRCDQCSYCCHRMDQLNSHKLRHQSKSLICEICAYACKRKYELRKHMLAKHCGEGKQQGVHQCKYCTYTTSYRQALKNHENCKHTKLKEFRCALCTYSSFSTISLFLHKRKVHGYIPGDKVWLENYAAKEKKNTNESMHNFYEKDTAAHEQSGPSVNEAPLSLTTTTTTDNQREQTDLSGPENQQKDQGTVSGSQSSHLNVNSGPSPAGALYRNCTEEEYCTLVLTNLSTAEYESMPLPGKIKDSSIGQYKTNTAGCKGPGSAQERTAIVTSGSATEETSVDLEENDSDQNEYNEKDGPVKNTVCVNQPNVDDIQISAMEEVGENATSSSPYGNFDSQIRMKAMKKHDRDQADAMVLEGRVKMFVTQSENVYRCSKCSYVTRKETALKYHCQSVCRGRLKGHQCKTCGAQFKQRRSFEAHLLGMCTAQQRKTRKCKVLTVASSVAEVDPVQSQDRSRQLDSVSHSDQTEPSSLEEMISKDSEGQDSLQQSAELICPPPLANCNRHVKEAVVSESFESAKQRKMLQVKKYKNMKAQQTLEENTSHSLQNTTLYCETNGKYKCNLCSFSSAKLVTIERHCSVYRKPSSKQSEYLLERDADVDGNEAGQSGVCLVQEDGRHPVKVTTKGQTFSCPGCPFRCSQKRTMDSHSKQGCLKPDESQCHLCSFVAKSQNSLTSHVSSVHKNNQSKGKLNPKHESKRLQCEHCVFTCKQERCMVQHTAVKHKGARPHRCQYCPFSTTRRYRLEEHESLHTGVGRHGCRDCGKTFGAMTKLRQHKKRVHDRRPTHFCSRCDFSSYTLDDVRRHGQRCHAGHSHRACAHCEATFSSDAALRNHCKRVHQLQENFSCPHCDHTCGSEAGLKAHVHSMHRPHRCASCQEVFHTKELLAKHQRTHLAHRCQLCPFASKTRQVLAQHLLDEHEEGPPVDKPLRCSNCEFACRNQLVLEQHLRSHGGMRLYKCNDCKYSTRNKQKITWHMRIHTGEKPYTCDLCSYACADPSRLKFHMRVHEEHKKYLCPVCGYKCKWSTQLKYHMTKHTGEKPYVCEDCSYRSNRADALRAHRLTQHCEARSYVCEKCGKAFKTRFILKSHQRRHSDDRPYACGLCDKAFRWPAGLRHHFLSHTKQQPFCCKHCSYRAKQRFQVVKHLQKNHPGVSLEQGVVRDADVAGLTLKEAMKGTLGESLAEAKTTKDLVPDEEV